MVYNKDVNERKEVTDMLTYDDVMEIGHQLKEEWGEQGEIVFAKALTCRKERTCNSFLNSCTLCGGNWGAMFLSGLKELYPSVWEAIPDEMGHDAFTLICNIMYLCGVEFER